MRQRFARCPRGKRWNRRAHRCVWRRSSLARGARREAVEHPWASKATARRIARDHLKENPRAYGGKRDQRSGRYTYSTLDRMCVCGHALGLHTSAAPHECIAGDFGFPPCSCRRFRPRR